MGDPVVHLHLEHPFVQRALSRFRAQGYGQTDLSRATIVRVAGLYEPRVVAFARLSLFGRGARRLHDELVSVAAPWEEAAGSRHLRPFGLDTHRSTLELLDRTLAAGPVPPTGQADRLVRYAEDDFAALWPHLADEADARAADAEVALEARGRKDAEALAGILTRQARAIDERIGQLALGLDHESWAAGERHQLRRDREHMADRRRQLDQELQEEPRAIQDLFAVDLRRVIPVGLVYLWPETR